MPLSSGFILTSVRSCWSGWLLVKRCHLIVTQQRQKPTSRCGLQPVNHNIRKEVHTCNSLIRESPSNITQDASLPGSKGHVFFLFQDGERCRFLAQESRTSDTQGVPARKVQAAEGKETVDTTADVFNCFYQHLNAPQHLFQYTP